MRPPADTLVLQYVQYVVSRTALRELAVAVEAYNLNGAVYIGLVSYESLAEVVSLACSLENLALEV